MAKMARAKVDLLSPERLSGIYRNRCPGFSGNGFFRIFGAGDDAMAYYSAIAGFSCSIS
jgi:hypothetical protein